MSSDVYLIGDTVRLKATIKDFDGNLTDPAAATVSVLKDDGTVVLSCTTATKSSTGVYIYDWTISNVTDRCSLIVQWWYEDTSGKTHYDTQRITVAPRYGG